MKSGRLAKLRSRAENFGMCASPIDKWQGLRVFVLGDVMLDRYVYGNVERVSPEAPIPVLHHQTEKVMPGGAANVARNIVAFGGQAVLAGVVGTDLEADLVADCLKAQDNIDARLVRIPGHQTTTKTRYVSGGQQIMRLDLERGVELNEADSATIVSQFTAIADNVDAVVLSDYAKGVLSPEVIRQVIDAARARSIPVVVDPKSRDVQRYAGASVITPNASEAAEITGLDCSSDETAGAAAIAVRDLAMVDAVVITRGARGMTIWDPSAGGGRPTTIATLASEVSDVSGAGDTVTAALSLSLASGASVLEGGRVANVAGGLAVGKSGTAVVLAHELATALQAQLSGGDGKIVGLEEAARIVGIWKADGLRVGFTNGCFDLLHPGHVELLKRSRAACDRLIVGLNTDASVRRLKGPNRPVQDEHARSIVMASIKTVDLVILFDDDTPIRLIETLKPEYLIKGSDYTVMTVVGADLVQSYGGKVLLVPLEAGHSTTSIIARASEKLR